MKTVYNMAILELKNSLKSRWLIAYSFSYLLLGLSLSYFSIIGLGYLGFKAIGRITSTLINLSLYLIPLISLILGGIGIVGDKEDGTLEWLFSEPLSPSDYILGKFTGLISGVSIATVLGFGLASWILVIFLPPEDITKYFNFIIVAILLSAACVGIGILISTISKSRFEALGISFFVWFFLVFMYDLISMGLSIALDLREKEVFMLTILNPVESARILMIYTIDPELTFLGAAGIYTAREIGALLPITLSMILIIYTVVTCIVSYLLFKSADKI